MARRRGAGAVVALVVAIVIVAAAVVGGNTVGKQYAEKQTAVTIQTRANLALPPTVTISDSMFSWSVLRQRFDQVHVVIPALPVKVLDTYLRPAIDVTLTDVVASDMFSTYVAGHLEGTATLPYDQLGSLAGNVSITPVGTDKISAQITVPVAGTQIHGVVTAVPSIDSSGRLTFTSPTLSVAGITIPPAVVASVLTGVLQPIDLPLPGGIKATSASVTQNGLMVGIRGDDVNVTRLI